MAIVVIDCCLSLYVAVERRSRRAMVRALDNYLSLSLSLSLSASRSDFLFALSIPSRALYTLFVRDVLTSTSSSSLLVVLLPAAVTESCCARMLRVPSPTCGTE